MWIDNAVFKEDMEYISCVDYIDWNKLVGKTIFITGGTGLIGYYLASSLIYRNIYYDANITIFLLVRDLGKARKMYEKQLIEDGRHIRFFEGSVEKLPLIDCIVDYVVHGGGPTDSSFFVQHPVETVTSLVHGTETILSLARKNQVFGCVFLSSMEVYGAIMSPEKLAEDHGCNLNTMSARSSYPESKRLCENLCADYAHEYGLPVYVLRLAQTFGPGIQRGDKRLFAQLIDTYLESKDIMLLTDGKSCRSYIYLADAVTAILTVLLSGEKGNAYNAANEDTYCSICEIAKLVAEKVAKNKIKVIHKTESEQEVARFSPLHMLNLDTGKLKNLSWRANTNLLDMFLRTIYVIENP